MKVYELILKKREGKELNRDEINFLVSGYVSGKIPDYQMSTYLMAVFFQGMNKQETVDFTLSLVNSGEKINLAEIKGKKIDKHSTGGVGDKTSLVLLPLLAASGLFIAKMSGRSLGHTGGTIDKLESIPNFRTELSKAEFISQVKKINLSIVSQSENLVPADKKIYALRDLTATVESIPLIASSVMSKKIAAGAEIILLDVKFGNGAFMKTYPQAKELAKTMQEIGQGLKRKVIAAITDMNQPLGLKIGNSLEVEEAMETLKNQGPEDLKELCLRLGAYVLQNVRMFSNLRKAKNFLQEILEKKIALKKFEEMIIAQGGNKEVINDFSLLPQAKFKEEIKSKKYGYLQKIETQDLGAVSMFLGAGREKKEDKIDLAAGIILKKKLGDRIKKGEVLAIVQTNQREKIKLATEKIEQVLKIGSERLKLAPLIYEVLQD